MDFLKKLWDLLGHIGKVETLVVLLTGCVGMLGVTINFTPQDLLQYLAVAGLGFSGSSLVGLLAVRSGNAVYRKVRPLGIVVTPKGGNAVTLEVCATNDDYYYGYGWLQGPCVTRQHHFDLQWQDNNNKKFLRAGDTDTIEIATIDGNDYRKLWIHGDPSLVHIDDSQEIAHRYCHTKPTEWYYLQVKIRSDGIHKSLDRKYRFRLGEEYNFEVEEVSTQ